MFRDCNGESNGIELPEETLQAEASANGDEEAIVFPEIKEENLEELSQQIEEEEEELSQQLEEKEEELLQQVEEELEELSQEVEEDEALPAALPLPILNDLDVDYDEIPLNGLYQAPGAQ